jgi:hypothetical protein
MANARDIYPTTIIFTRYGGVYESGRWAALDCSHEEVPGAASGDDIECAEFWALACAGRYEIRDWRARAELHPPVRQGPSGGSCRRLSVGAGSTPDAALTSMLERRPQGGD